jgi:hypothetical protein
MGDFVSYSQLVIGPPGSGKSCYCKCMKKYFLATGRKCATINLDPANEGIQETFGYTIDITDLISLSETMEKLKLGPNGALIFCMEFLEKNFDWLERNIRQEAANYLVFDFPGQVELFSHHNSVRNIAHRINKIGCHTVVVQLIDVHVCCRPSTFVSAALLSLSCMLKLELPHVNVLSKVDLFRISETESFNVEFYESAENLEYLLPHMDYFSESGYTNERKDGLSELEKSWSEKNRALTGKIIEILQEFHLVNFHSFTIKDIHIVGKLVKIIDHVSGYSGTKEGSKK